MPCFGCTMHLAPCPHAFEPGCPLSWLKAPCFPHFTQPGSPLFAVVGLLELYRTQQSQLALIVLPASCPVSGQLQCLCSIIPGITCSFRHSVRAHETKAICTHYQWTFCVKFQPWVWLWACLVGYFDDKQQSFYKDNYGIHCLSSLGDFGHIWSITTQSDNNNYTVIGIWLTINIVSWSFPSM